MSENFVKISVSDISETALDGVIRNHLLKEASYDSSFVDIENKSRKIKDLLKTNKMVLVFDIQNEEVSVVSSESFEDFKARQAKMTPIWHGALPPDENLPF